MNERLKMANPQYDSHHTIPDRIAITGIWKCWFGGEGKLEHSEKAFLKQGSEPKTNTAHMKPGHGGNSFTCTYTVPPLHSFHDYFAS